MRMVCTKFYDWIVYFINVPQFDEINIAEVRFTSCPFTHVDK